MQLLIVLCLAAVATCLPAHNGTLAGQSYVPLHPQDYAFINSLPQARLAAVLPGFSYIFVDASGRSSYTRGSLGSQIEIAGSPLTPPEALVAAADLVAKMTKYMPSGIFYQLASTASIGIFTAAEKLIIYPEYASLASGSCGSSCSGSCSHTCTFDGRKYEDIAGVGGARAVVLDDNVLCSAQDPYRHTQNILSHEFTHTIHSHGVPSSTKQEITAAYNAAKASATWTLSSYAMSNEAEYFAEGGSVFFFVNQDNHSSGGMSFCSSNRLCTTEHAAREHLRQADQRLYNALNYVFTNNRPDLVSGLTICPPASIVG